MAGKKTPKESSIENYFVRRCKELNIFVLKNTGMNGICDRLLIKDGIVVFLELKRPGEKPRPLQRAIIKKLRMRGVIARYADTKAKIDGLLEIFESPGKITPRAERKRRLLAGMMISAIERWRDG